MSALRGRRQGGIAVVEFTLMLPFLLILMFAVADLGRAVLTRQVLINISREAANLSARGTALSDALAAAQISAAPLNLGKRGFVILTEVHSDAAGKLTILRQLGAGGMPRPSRVGSEVGKPATLPASPTPIPPPGQNLFVAEVFYQLDAVTPLGNLIGAAVGGSYYDVAFF